MKVSTGNLSAHQCANYTFECTCNSLCSSLSYATLPLFSAVLSAIIIILVCYFDNHSLAIPVCYCYSLDCCSCLHPNSLSVPQQCKMCNMRNEIMEFVRYFIYQRNSAVKWLERGSLRLTPMIVPV